MTERNYPRNRVLPRYRRLLLKAGSHENMIKPGGGGDNEASTTNQRASCRFRKGTKGVRIIPMELRLFPEACCKQTPRAPRHAPSHVVYSKRLRSCTVQSCSDQLTPDLQMPTSRQRHKQPKSPFKKYHVTPLRLNSGRYFWKKDVYCIVRVMGVPLMGFPRFEWRMHAKIAK
jgi:hypothetical protein